MTEGSKPVDDSKVKNTAIGGIEKDMQRGGSC
jgi:hypothetical protein